MFTIGGHSTFTLCKKAGAIIANGARLHQNCVGNDRVLTIGFQSETASGNRGEKGDKDREEVITRL